jgi:hypothetical protein
MIYIAVTWNHDFADEPLRLYSELDDGRWEVRKVEQFRDGRLGYASKHTHKGSTRLGLEPVTEIKEINREPEFEARQITKPDFERIWEAATTAS